MRLLNRLVALSLVFTFAVSVHAQDKPKVPSSSGIVKSIDSKSITLEGKKNKAGEVLPATYALAADLKVMASGKEAKAIADVKVGLNVSLMLSEDSKTVTTIYLAGDKKPDGEKTKQQSANGNVKALDTKSITLEGKKNKAGEAQPDATYALATDIKVMAGKEAKAAIADVKVGLNVYVLLSEDLKTVTTIYLVVDKKPDGEKTKQQAVNGTVKTIDAKSITLEGKKNKAGDVQPETTYSIVADVKVTMGKDAKAIADIKTGANVYLMLSSDMKSVTAIILPVEKKPGEKKPEGEKPGVKPVEKPGDK